MDFDEMSKRVAVLEQKALERYRKTVSDFVGTYLLFKVWKKVIGSLDPNEQEEYWKLTGIKKE